MSDAGVAPVTTVAAIGLGSMGCDDDASRARVHARLSGVTLPGGA